MSTIFEFQELEHPYVATFPRPIQGNVLEPLNYYPSTCMSNRGSDVTFAMPWEAAPTF